MLMLAAIVFVGSRALTFPSSWSKQIIEHERAQKEKAEAEKKSS